MEKPKLSRESIRALSFLALRNNNLTGKYKDIAESGWCASYIHKPIGDTGPQQILCLVCLNKFDANPYEQTEWTEHLLSHLKDLKIFI